jgi:hypothetical protein
MYGAAFGLPPASTRAAPAFFSMSLRRGHTGPNSAC